MRPKPLLKWSDTVLLMLWDSDLFAETDGITVYICNDLVNLVPNAWLRSITFNSLLDFFMVHVQSWTKIKTLKKINLNPSNSNDAKVHYEIWCFMQFQNYNVHLSRFWRSIMYWPYKLLENYTSIFASKAINIVCSVIPKFSVWMH